MGRMMGPRNQPLPDPEIAVAEFMKDEPHGDRYEIHRENVRWYNFPFQVSYIHANGVTEWARFACTEWGARRIIRKDRKARTRKVITTLVDWERS